MIPQFLTEAVLRERLAELGHRPAFDPRARCVCARQARRHGGRHEREGQADDPGAFTSWARNGGRSFVRHRLGVDFPGKTLGVRALVADILVDGVSRDAWHRWGEGSADQISLCPLAGTAMFQLQGPIPREGDIDLSAEGLSALLVARTGRKDIVVRSVSWASRST